MCATAVSPSARITAEAVLRPLLQRKTFPPMRAHGSVYTDTGDAPPARGVAIAVMRSRAACDGANS